MKILLITLLLIISHPTKSSIQPKKKKGLTEQQVRRIKIIRAISKHESSLNPDTVNHKEHAIGLLQIRPIMIKEVNNITHKHYTEKDCYSAKKSIEMFVAYQEHYNPKWDAEKAARLWNGGATGMNKESTVAYWNAVKNNL